MLALTFWASDRWIARGATPTRVRKTFVVTGLLICTLMLPAAMVHDWRMSMALLIVACLSFGIHESNFWPITLTLAGPQAVGKWTGMQNCFGNLAGITTPWITGVIVNETKSFHMAFALVAVLVTLGAASYAFMVGRLEPIRWGSPPRE